MIAIRNRLFVPSNTSLKETEMTVLALLMQKVVGVDDICLKLDDETMNAQRYIDRVLPIALKCGNKMLGNN